jgi:hypothetical protein
MKAIFNSIPVLMFFLILPTISWSQPVDEEKEFLKCYMSADYARAASLLEKEIDELKNKQQDTENNFNKLYIKYLQLSYIYAWKLNDPEKALKFYMELTQLRQSYKYSEKIPAFELLNIADVYESKKDLLKAEQCYRKLLNELSSFKDKEDDDVSIIMADELIRLVKYQIDGINLKSGKATLLPELKFSSVMLQSILPFLYVSLFPVMECESNLVSQTSLTEYIKKSPNNVSSMFFNYSLILSAAGESIDEPSEQAMTAYIAKYPDSYCALLLRYMFYNYYIESSQKKKAETLMLELKAIGKKRGMRLVIGPEEKFSSPEKTWAIYTKALSEGDIPLALDCHAAGGNKYSEIFQVVGREKLKEMALKMRSIGKITADQTTAKYRIKRDLKGEDITFYIYFTNINGEWKILEY